MQKLCFMVMPFGRKLTSAPNGVGPAEVDFNRLWDLVYVPVIESLGYQAVRADQESGSMIITQMLERLFFADLVLADMTIPNGNVYYEVGIRHAAKEGGCVMLSADWSKQLFDLAQIRTGRYPLPEGEITSATAEIIKPILKQKIEKLIGGRSPMHECIKGYPDQVDIETATTMRDWVTQQAKFQAQLRAISSSSKATQLERAAAFFNELLTSNALTPPMALGLVKLMRDCAEDSPSRSRVLALMECLPDVTKNYPELSEQHALLMSQVGDVQAAIDELLSLIECHGATPERLGLLAGRYKRLSVTATDAFERKRYLSEAIKYYEAGMVMDLNEYYCSSNLPRLYRQRGLSQDHSLAQKVLNQVLLACERALKRGISDIWLRPTLLNAAFDAGDAQKAEELLETVLIEGHETWKLESIVDDLAKSAGQVIDFDSRQRLNAVLETLKSSSRI